MNAQEKIRRGYKIMVRPLTGTADSYRVSYIPRDRHQAEGSGKPAKRVPEFSVAAKALRHETVLKWDKTPSEPGVTQEDFDADVRARVRALHAWIEQLTSLMSFVRAWAEELGWATRDVEKPLEEADIGDYKAPALVLQRDMTRIGVEPIGRAAPGVEGLVDLYVLPAYDDIAGLFLYDNHWHLSHPRRTAEFVEDKRLTKKAFRDLLDQLTQNGG